MTAHPHHRRWLALLLLCAAIVAPSCGGKDKDIVSKTGGEADKFLFEKGTAALDKHRWFTSREYFSRLLVKYQGNVARCARHSGLSRRSVTQKLQKYDLDRSLFRAAFEDDLIVDPED